MCVPGASRSAAARTVRPGSRTTPAENEATLVVGERRRAHRVDGADRDQPRVVRRIGETRSRRVPVLPAAATTTMPAFQACSTA